MWVPAPAESWWPGKTECHSQFEGSRFLLLCVLHGTHLEMMMVEFKLWLIPFNAWHCQGYLCVFQAEHCCSICSKLASRSLSVFLMKRIQVLSWKLLRAGIAVCAFFIWLAWKCVNFISLLRSPGTRFTRCQSVQLGQHHHAWAARATWKCNSQNIIRPRNSSKGAAST